MQDLIIYVLFLGMLALGIFSYPLSRKLYQKKTYLAFLIPLILWIFVGILIYLYLQISDLLALGILIFAILFAVGALVSTIVSVVIVLKNKTSKLQ